MDGAARAVPLGLLVMLAGTIPWIWSLVAGGLGIVTLVIALRLLNRVVQLPAQHLPDLSQVLRSTVFALLLTAAPVAGIVMDEDRRRL
jgi:hypothetical protein